jgi:predicted secreted protein
MAYNTTPFHGKACRVEKNNVAMSYGDGWDINSNLDLAEITASGDSWKTHVAGFAGWSGSFGGSFVAGNTEQKAFFDNLIAATPGTKLTDVKFLLDGATNALNGNIFVTAIRVTGRIGDKTTFSVDFTGDGALSLTDAA